MSDLLVLCYHAVHPRWPATLSVRPDALERQLTHVLERGYRGATFSAALSEPSPDPQVVVTFDDGFRSVLDRAAPILERLGLPGTLFVPTDWPGRTGPMRWAGIDQWLGTEFEPELHSLDWDELRGLRDAGWEIGAHTCDHPRLPTVADDAELDRQLAQSRAAVARELGACRSLAYPYGAVDDRVRAATARAGFPFACTLPEVKSALPPAADPLLYPRMPIHRKDDFLRFRVKISRRIRRARRTRAFAAAAERATGR